MLVFGKSYLTTAMFFALFALGGAIRLFKTFYHYFPQYWREIAFATLFLPSVNYWSSGVLKDSICFGAVGYIMYGFLNIFILKKRYFNSLVFISVSILLLFYIKIYILLALSPGIVLWLFSELNKSVENKTLRSIMSVLTFIGGTILGLLLVNYATSEESLKAFRLDALVETSSNSRAIYEDIAKTNTGAYFSLGTSNPFLLIPFGIVATLFRPFIWEVNGVTALLSALEALLFFYFTIKYFFKIGFFSFFKNAFKKPILILCFVFSIVFAIAIGSTALNFGSLSRYKIPCLPFYLVMVMVMSREAGLSNPKWLNRILGYRVHQKPVDRTLLS